MCERHKNCANKGRRVNMRSVNKWKPKPMSWHIHTQILQYLGVWRIRGEKCVIYFLNNRAVSWNCSHWFSNKTDTANRCGMHGDALAHIHDAENDMAFPKWWMEIVLIIDFRYYSRIQAHVTISIYDAEWLRAMNIESIWKDSQLLDTLQFVHLMQL